MTIAFNFWLGFQLLIMAIMLALHLDAYVIPFFHWVSALILVFVAIRKIRF